MKKKRKIPVNLQEVEPALWNFQCTKGYVVWKGTKPAAGIFFKNFSILTLKRVVINYTSTVLQKKHKNEGGFAAQLVFVYTPAMVLNSPFIQITALSHHEKAPLCCAVI